MSAHNIQIYDKIRHFLKCLFQNFLGTQKQVRISHVKRAIRIRDIEVRPVSGQYSISLQSLGNRVYDRWIPSHLPFEYHSYGSNQQGGFCPKGILSILWRGFCPPCKDHEGDYVHPVKSFKGDYVHLVNLVKNMKGISSTYAKMSRGDFVRGGFCPKRFDRNTIK